MKPLRGRKKGTVSGGGAQEDGARAIEDVTAHFDWRPSAKRAIFFLGDEAFEGGGSDIDKEDLDAANRSIDAAKQGGVRVHTYLGTSGARRSSARLSRPSTRVSPARPAARPSRPKMR